MTVLPRVFLIGLFGLCAFAARGAAPPNDNFVDRIVLTGNSVTFTGTLAGATKELPWEANGSSTTFLNLWTRQSVWWEWTATTSGVVTLQIIAASPSPRQPWEI